MNKLIALSVVLLALVLASGASAHVDQEEDPGGGGAGTTCTYSPELHGAILSFPASLAPPNANLISTHYICAQVSGPIWYIYSYYYVSFFAEGYWYPGGLWNYGDTGSYYAWVPTW